MPLARYFLFVGGVLLVLLVISDAYLPKPAVSDRTDSNPPVVSTHSDRKWPERVVYDTGAVMIVRAPVANPETKPPAKAADVTAGMRDREAFAQLQQPSGAKQLRSPDVQQLEPALQRKHKNARRHAAQATRQPRYGFRNYIWWTTGQ